MTCRPTVVAFDVIETLFLLEPLRARLSEAGLPEHALEVWFASLLRDAFAVEATGTYRPLREVAGSSLRTQFSRHGIEANPDAIDAILGGFVELNPHPDVAPAMRMLTEADVRIVTLTNGSGSVTEKLLARAGVADLVERAISVDEVQRWTPNGAVYRHCAKTAGIEPGALALVAAHGWDIHGAGCAGLITGYVARAGAPFQTVMRPPDLTGSSLTEVVDGLRPRGSSPCRRNHPKRKNER